MSVGLGLGRGWTFLRHRRRPGRLPPAHPRLGYRGSWSETPLSPGQEKVENQAHLQGLGEVVGEQVRIRRG